MKRALCIHLTALVSAAFVLHSIRLAGAEQPASSRLTSALQPFVDSHTLAGAVMLVASKSGLILVWMVQHAGYPGPDGARVQPTFTKTATEAFGPQP